MIVTYVVFIIVINYNLRCFVSSIKERLNQRTYFSYGSLIDNITKFIDELT